MSREAKEEVPRDEVACNKMPFGAGTEQYVTTLA